MQSFFNGLLATAVVLSGVNAALGDVMFTENFNTDHTANWTTNIIVTSVPEPTALVLGLIGATLTFARRRIVFHPQLRCGASSY